MTQVLEDRFAQYVADNDSRLRGRVGRRTVDRDDRLQEGYIASWNALQKRPDATDAYLRQAALWRIGALERGDGMTGTPARRRDPLTQPHGGSNVMVAARDLYLTPDDTDAWSLSAHSAAIARALNSLPWRWRMYVWLRFWADADRNSISEVTGASSTNLATTWRTQIRPRLRDQLSFLEGAV